MTGRPVNDPSTARAADLRRRGLFVCAMAVLFALIVYQNSLGNPFVYDDYRLIVENTSIVDLGNWRAVLLHDIVRPLVNVSYAIDYALWGPEPFGFHLTNVVLHGFNVALFALIAWGAAADWRQRRVGDAAPYVVAPVAAGLFAVHPVMSAAVGYITGRSELLCGAFLLLAMLAARRRLIGGSAWWVPPAILAWLFALASKEIAVMFPFLVLAYDWWLAPRAPDDAKRRIRRLHLPLFVVTLTLVVIRVAVFVGIESPGGVAPRWDYALGQVDVIRRYFILMLAPVGQSIFHDVPTPSSMLDSRFVLSATLLGFALWLIAHHRQRLPGLSFGLLWFILLLLPSSVLAVMGRAELMVEHRVYLAGPGLLLAAGFLADQYRLLDIRRRRGTKIIMAAGMTAIVLTLAGRTMIRNALWGNPALVWLEAAELAPKHWLPPLLLGEELHRQGRHSDAAALFRRVIEINPREPAAFGRLGVCLSELSDFDEAVAAFEQQQALDPTSAEASNGLAAIALVRGDLEGARRGFLSTLSRDSINIAARRGLAAIEETAGNYREALRWCGEIRQLVPRDSVNDECIRRNQSRIDAGGR